VHLAIWKLYFSESGKFAPIFKWKILCIGFNYIFKVEIWGNFPQNTNAGLQDRL
jgi:hypothetical protein